LAVDGGSCRVPGCWLGSSDECGDEGAKQGFAASARVVHELEEAEVERQFVLRDAPVRAQPGTQQRPKSLCGRPWRSNACLSGRSTVLRRIGQPGDDGNFLAWSVSRYVTGYKGLASCCITRGRQCWRDVPERLDHVGAGLAHRSSDRRLAITQASAPSFLNRRSALGKSGQLRPYVRPVARRMPLAIMGVRLRVRHQSP